VQGTYNSLINFVIAAALFWQSASMKVITTEQQEFLGKELLKIFCPNNMKVKVLFS